MYYSLTSYNSTFVTSLFLELIPYLFSFERVTSFLSEQLNQDPLEKVFGCQCQNGRSNEKPAMAKFLKNTQGYWFYWLKGN